jgi:hypothetical protein
LQSLIGLGNFGWLDSWWERLRGRHLPIWLRFVEPPLYRLGEVYWHLGTATTQDKEYGKEVGRTPTEVTQEERQLGGRHLFFSGGRRCPFQPSKPPVPN